MACGTSGELSKHPLCTFVSFVVKAFELHQPQRTRRYTKEEDQRDEMAIPLSYNVRNLRLRKSLTVMTALGIALTVATAVFIMALLAGLGRAFGTTGDPLNVLMLRKGSDSELAAGGVSRDAMQVLKDLPGVAKNSKGEPLVSGEDILVVVMPRKGGTGETNVTTRFLTP